MSHVVILNQIFAIHSIFHTLYSEIRHYKKRDVGAFKHLAGESRSGSGIGGMITKFDAAEIALAAGVEMWIANGRTENAIQLALDGAIGTHFIL